MKINWISNYRYDATNMHNFVNLFQYW